jgi:hypothetical protein
MTGKGTGRSSYRHGLTGMNQVLGRLWQRVQLLLAGDNPDRPYNYQLGVLVNSDDKGIGWLGTDSGGPISDWRRVSAETVPHGPA